MVVVVKWRQHANLLFVKDIYVICRLGGPCSEKLWPRARKTQDHAPLQRQATNNQTNSHNFRTLNSWFSCDVVISGAIIGDGDRKRALILLLGLSPWYGTIFLFLEQIATSPVAHAHTCSEDVWICREGEMTSVIPEMFDAFGPQQPTTQYVHVCWNFTSVFSS